MSAVVRARWAVLALAAAAIFVPVGLLEAIEHELQSLLDLPELLADGELLEVTAALILVAAGALLGDVLYAGVVAAVVIAERERGARTLSELLSELPLLRLIVVDLLLTVIVVLGFLALVVPGLILLTWFALVAPVVKVEHTSVAGAFRRSRELVRGNFWLVFSIALPLVIASAVVTELAQSVAVELLGESFPADWLGATLANLLIAPVYALAVVTLYFELRRWSDAAAAGR